MSLEKKMYQRPARKAWAAETGQVLHYAIAKDRISSMALREKPDLGKEKLTWLQQHDQDCGSLYGVLPLCLGMPVAAADHLDRSRGILRGCAGEIVGWVWPADAVGGASQEATQIWNELPACILVRFKTKTTWRIEEIDEDTLFLSRRKRNRGIWTRGEGGQYSVSHGSSFHGSRVCPPRTQPKGKLAKKALSWTCTLAKQATH